MYSFTWGNGVTHATTFDADYRQTGLTDTGTAALQSLTYGYDADNNLHTVTDSLNAANTQTLTNDHLERLTGAVSGTGGYGTLSYTYDNNGNRKTSGSTTYTIASTSNRVTAVGSTSIGYIATGNINAIGSNSMTYNKANQLATATVSSTASTYTYDAFGNRLTAKVGSGTVSVEEYDQQGNMLTETNSGTETDYVYLDGVPVAAIQPAAATISYILPDRLGTPQKATNAGKTVVWTTTYQPFGVTGTITSSITQNLRLPGQYADATGYNHNGFRDYYAAYGRYLESDPIGLNGGGNTYAYVGSNPATWIDPKGLETPSVTLGLPPNSGAYPQVGSSNPLGAAIAAAIIAPAIFELLPEVAAVGEVEGLPIAAPLAEVPSEPVGNQCTVAQPSPGQSFGKLGTVVENPELDITGFKSHGLDQAVTRGVSAPNLLNTVNNPAVVLQQSGGQYLYLSNQAAVVLSPSGQVITTYPSSMFDPVITNIIRSIPGN